MSELKEACGVIGIYNNDDLNIAKELYYGIFALHHRGQESCGMAVCSDGVVKDHKGMGLVNEIFTDADLEKLQGQIGIFVWKQERVIAQTSIFVQKAINIQLISVFLLEKILQLKA